MNLFFSKNTGRKYQTFFGVVLLMFFVLQIVLSLEVAHAQQVQDPGLTGQPSASEKQIQPCNDRGVFTQLMRFDIMCMFFQAADIAVTMIIWVPLHAGEAAVTKAIDLNKSGFANLAFLQIGWTKTRDVANIFFIFILLWIALATIFDIQNYSAKALLPRFVFAALMINFSLAIGLAVVSVTTQVADIFWPKNLYYSISSITSPAWLTAKGITVPQIKSAVEIKNKDDQALFDKIANSEKFARLYCPGKSYLGGLCPGAEKVYYRDCKAMRNPNTQVENTEAELNKQVACRSQETAALNEFNKAKVNASDNSMSYAYAQQVISKLIIGLVASFVIFALAFLLLIRYITLIFVLVLGPFAFLGYILPITQRWWHEWWDSLLKWSFFYPAFAIFFSISIGAIRSLNTEVVALGENAEFAALLTNLLLASGFMIGSLIAAQKIGISAAGSAMNLGTRWAKNAGRIAASPVTAPARVMYDKARANAKEYGTRIGGAALKNFGVIPGVKATGELMQMKATQQQIARRGKAIDDLSKMNPQAASKYLLQRTDKGAMQQIEAMHKQDPDRLKRVMANTSAEDQMKLSKIAGPEKQHIIAAASNNPEVAVQILHPGVKENDPETYQGFVKSQFASMDKRNIDPAFVQKMNKDTARTMSEKDVSTIGSSSGGARALSSALQRLGNATLEERAKTYEKVFDETYKSTLQKETDRVNSLNISNPADKQSKIQEAEEFSKALAKESADKAAKAIPHYLSLPAQNFIKTSPGQAIAMGRAVTQQENDLEKTLRYMKRVEQELKQQQQQTPTQQQQPQSGGEGQTTTP